MAICTSAKVTAVRVESGKTIVAAEIDNDTRDFPAEEILVVTGVRPDTEDPVLEV